MIRKLKNFICKLLGIKQCACPEDMQVEVLNEDRIVKEIARMLSGELITSEALAAASTLRNSSRMKAS